MAKQDISVRQLVDKVISRELALPEMQRRYVWSSTKVRDLIDSLYRGYPSGTILVWDAGQTRDERALQISGTTEPAHSGRLLLLDGQQRLTSLTAILEGRPIDVRNKKRPIEILFNLDHPETISEEEVTAIESEELEEEEDANDTDEDDEDEDNGKAEISEELRKRTFVVGTKSLKNDPRWISVSDVFKKSESQLLKPLGINSENPAWDKYSERIRKLKKIEDYQYVMLILDKNLSYEEVTEIFVRVNSLGAKLRGSDLALAQITSKWKGFLKELDRFASEFESNKDYLLDTGILVKSLVAFATGQSKFKTVSRVSQKQFEEAWKSTKVGLRFAINFLRTNAQIENLRLLGSPFLLVPLSIFATLRKEKLSKEDVKKLLLWFYVSHYKQRYSLGSSENYLDSDIATLNKTGKPDELLSILRLQVKDFFTSEDQIKGRNRRSPYFSLLFMISKQQGVKDFATGLGLSERMVGKAHAVQFHHIFPKSLLRDLGTPYREINDIANLAFIGGKTNRNISNKEPIKYLPKVMEDRGEEVFDQHHIPSSEKLWELNQYNGFLEYRRARLVKAINDFLKRFV